MAATVMMRMREDSHRALREIAEQEHSSLQDVLAKAVELYRKTLFFEQMNAAFERLRSDPAAWAQELEEREDWDAALMDGLEVEAPHSVHA